LFCLNNSFIYKYIAYTYTSIYTRTVERATKWRQRYNLYDVTSNGGKFVFIGSKKIGYFDTCSPWKNRFSIIHSVSWWVQIDRVNAVTILSTVFSRDTHRQLCKIHGPAKNNRSFLHFNSQFTITYWYDILTAVLPLLCTHR